MIYVIPKPERISGVSLVVGGSMFNKLSFAFDVIFQNAPDHWTKNLAKIAGPWIFVGFYSYFLDHIS